MRGALAGSERTVFWALACAAFAAAAAGLVARAADRLAENYETQRTNYAIVRVLAPEGAAGLAAAETVLAGAPHVTAAARMTEARAAALLEQWGGAPVSGEELPDLRLIEVDLAPAPATADLSGDVEAALAAGGVTAELIEAPATASGGGLAARISAAALWGALGFSLLMAMIAGLAARTLAARRANLVEVLADLGATRGNASARVADEAASLGFWAGVAGAALAGLAAAILLLALVPGATLDTLPRMILPIDTAPLVVAPLLAAIAAGMGARSAAEAVHANAARLA